MDHDEAVRLLGPWRARTPNDVADLLRGYPGRWWVAGGWAIEAFTGVTRRHDDIDPSIPRADVALLCERDARISRPLDEILWTRDGIDYLRPEVQLLHKARGLRPKDQADFEACLPRLDDAARRWLADALAVAHPGHPWLGRV